MRETLKPYDDDYYRRVTRGHRYPGEMVDGLTKADCINQHFNGERSWMSHHFTNRN
jgi:hypothetical protein